MTTSDRTRETLNDVLSKGIVVAVRLNTADGLEAICNALIDGGIRVLEMTLTTPGALEMIATLSSRDDVVMGGGTVLTPEDVRRVADAGGRFAFSPVCDATVVATAHRLGLLCVPGASTPTEILAAHKTGAHLVKVFPSGALGGANYIRAIRGPLPHIPLIPTSGPTAETIADYLDAGVVAVGVGGMELFGPGFTPESVRTAAAKVRAAFDAARRNN